MGVYDQAARYAAHSEPSAVTQRLMGAGWQFQEWVDSRTTPLPGDTDRTADRVAVLRNEIDSENPWALLLEFQTTHDPDKFDVTLVEVARLRTEMRHGADRRGKYSIIAALINLRDIAPPPLLDMVLPSGFGTGHAPIQWNLAGDSAEETLNAVSNGTVSWGMLFWLPLMRGGEVPALIEQWKELVRALPNRKAQSDLARIVIVFAELAGNYLAWQRALEGWDMTESPVVNSWIAAAEHNAFLEDRREMLRQVLHARFPQSISPEVEATIQSQPSLALLKDWVCTAATVQSMEAFIAILRR